SELLFLNIRRVLSIWKVPFFIHTKWLSRTARCFSRSTLFVVRHPNQPISIVTNRLSLPQVCSLYRFRNSFFPGKNPKVFQAFPGNQRIAVFRVDGDHVIARIERAKERNLEPGFVLRAHKFGFAFSLLPSSRFGVESTICDVYFPVFSA